MITYFKGTNAKIRIEIDDSNLVAQGIIGFSLIGTTIEAELQSADGYFLKFPSAKITVIDDKTFEIVPDETDVKKMHVGKQVVAVQITEGSNVYGLKIKNQLEVDSLINT